MAFGPTMEQSTLVITMKQTVSPQRFETISTTITKEFNISHEDEQNWDYAYGMMLNEARKDLEKAMLSNRTGRTTYKRKLLEEAKLEG
tara:strand:+ start:794 stop:1057 length:264 start_codon:yes stop_codon:yes gene_type:complete